MFLEIYDLPDNQCPNCGGFTVYLEKPIAVWINMLDASCVDCGWSGIWIDSLKTRTSSKLRPSMQIQQALKGGEK